MIFTFIGVPLSYGYFASEIIQSSEALTTKASDVILCFDSIYWAVVLIFVLRCIKNGSTRIITTKPYSPKLMLNLIEKYKISILWTIPFHFVASLKSDFITTQDISSVQKIVLYGSKIPSNLSAELNRYFPNVSIYSRYGMTEIGGVCEGPFDHRTNISTLRLVYDCTAVMIVDSSGNRCGPNINGEICIQKKYRFLGYLNDPKANEVAVNKNGFFKTGDIGHFNAYGTLVIEGRKKNTINVFYFDCLILPAEIEQNLITFADIRDVCVVGIPIMAGFSLPAIVIVRNDGSNISQRDVYNIVSGEW